MNNHVNSVVFSGNVVRDAEVKEINNSFVHKFTLAWDRFYKTSSGGAEVETVFLDVEVWTKEKPLTSLLKGQFVRLSGRLAQSRLTDEEGKKRERIFIRALEQDLEIKTLRPEPSEEANGPEDGSE